LKDLPNTPICQTHLLVRTVEIRVEIRVGLTCESLSECARTHTQTHTHCTDTYYTNYFLLLHSFKLLCLLVQLGASFYRAPSPSPIVDRDGVRRDHLKTQAFTPGIQPRPPLPSSHVQSFLSRGLLRPGFADSEPVQGKSEGGGPPAGDRD
jgi:hypothetical protein